MPPRRRNTRGDSRRSTRGPNASDDEMEDAPPLDDVSSLPVDASLVATPVPDDEEEEAPAMDEDEDEASSPPVIQSIPRRRRGPGRPPKSRLDSAGLDDDASDSGTPRRRRGPGRPVTGAKGGFRGRPRWGKKTEPDRMPIDKQGNTVEVIDDEADLPEDSQGELKVDRSGNLQGERDYRVRVFHITGRAERLYMLSTEPARCLGFRDSYLFFNKHLSLHKIVLSESEKMDLIEREVIPHSYKGRSIGVVTARSVFREFGARIIIGGKRVTDDYYETNARANGEVEGELADPHDRLPPAGEPYNKNQYVAWHGASQVYHTQPSSGTIPTGKQLIGKRRANVTVGNWQTEHATEASKFNSSLAAMRRANLDGVYDTHTNLLFYPKIMQPTHARWSAIPTPPTSTSDLDSDTIDRDEPPATGPTSNHNSDGIFPPVPPIIARNYAVIDTHFISGPPEEVASAAGGSTRAVVPGPDGDSWDPVGGSGPAAGLAHVAADVLAELPAECRAAFDEARAREVRWRALWKGEGGDGTPGRGNGGDGLREAAGLRVGYARFPTI